MYIIKTIIYLFKTCVGLFVYFKIDLNINLFLCVYRMISLDQSIIWQCEYKRNHRSKYQKRIRCFPTHSKIGHQV